MNNEWYSQNTGWYDKNTGWYNHNTGWYNHNTGSYSQNTFPAVTAISTPDTMCLLIRPKWKCLTSDVSSGCYVTTVKSKGKAIPLQALAVPESSRSLRLPDFKTIVTCRW
jgi:hypothetical protein